MGELHPGESKVVVELCPEDMPLSPEQQLKLKKLLGVRYNPETGIAKMSCDQFEHQAQNKRYLGDVINSLIENAKVCLLPPLFFASLHFSLWFTLYHPDPPPFLPPFVVSYRANPLHSLSLLRIRRTRSQTFPWTRDTTFSRRSSSSPLNGA